MIDAKNMAHNIRLNIMHMGFRAGSQGAHFGGSLSIVEILAVLYGQVLNCTPKTVNSPQRDRLILSKGHAGMALYATLKETGFLTSEDLTNFKNNENGWGLHPCRDLNHGIEISTGSLGQGLSIAAGIAYALNKKNNTAKIFVIIGDGECDEGAIWEAASFIAHHKLNNIRVIIDENKLQLDAPTRQIINKDNLAGRWTAFGFKTTIVNGHDIKELTTVLTEETDTPHAIIAQTIKGKGVSFIENNPDWHAHSLSPKQYEQALKELEYA